MKGKFLEKILLKDKYLFNQKWNNLLKKMLKFNQNLIKKWGIFLFKNMLKKTHFWAIFGLTLQLSPPEELTKLAHFARNWTHSSSNYGGGKPPSDSPQLVRTNKFVCGGLRPPNPPKLNCAGVISGKWAFGLSFPQKSPLL